MNTIKEIISDLFWTIVTFWASLWDWLEEVNA